jgi:hypothetical protein
MQFEYVPGATPIEIVLFTLINLAYWSTLLQ